MISDGSNGDVAVDQFNLYKEDVKTMKRGNFEAYRFSISWSRILPGGKLSGGINREAIKFYNDLIDALLAEGIEPMATIFHWDLPLALELEYGGVLSPKFVDDYLQFAELCFWEFGDRVKKWVTLNEPWSYTVFGYVNGRFPPGHGNLPQFGRSARFTLPRIKGSGPPDSEFQQRLRAVRGVVYQIGDEEGPGKEPYLVTHHFLLAHAKAVDLYRKQFQVQQGGKIGITLNSEFYEPYNDTDEDRDACIRSLDWYLGWYVAPIATGDYPPNMRKSVGDRLPQFTSDEATLLKGSYDFLGINYYTSSYAINTPKDPSETPTYNSDRETTFETQKDGVYIGPSTGDPTKDWQFIVPRGLYNLLVYTKEVYNIDLIYITENGLGVPNNPAYSLIEARFDPVRVQFFEEHLWYMKKAMRDDGVNVKAYYLWSFCDDFEWIDGYQPRFGIFHINYMDGKYTRYPKSSALWWMNFFNSKKRRNLLKKEAKEVEQERDMRKRARINN